MVIIRVYWYLKIEYTTLCISIGGYHAKTMEHPHQCELNMNTDNKIIELSLKGWGQSSGDWRGILS